MLIKRLFYLLALLLVVTGCGREFQKVLKSPDKEYKYEKAVDKGGLIAYYRGS